MLAIERRQEIMELISRTKSVAVGDLAKHYNVTEQTIRRDLDKLVDEGKVTKTYGGAVLENPVSEDPSFLDRLKVNMKQKKAIGSKAAELIEEGETIFIDMSTTALEVIKAVPDTMKITVITNSLEAIIELSHKHNIRLVTIGGTFDNNNLFMGGAMANRFIDHYYVDKTFFSVKALSKERGMMDSKEEIAEIKSRMVLNAREAILVIDGSKVDKTALINVIPMDKISTIVTDYHLDQQWIEILKHQNIEELMV